MSQSVKAIAERLVELCKTNQARQCLDELYAADAVSVEAMPMPGADSAETVGVAGIHGKHEWWENSFEVHDASVDGPYLHGDDRFGVIFEMDVTHKESSERSQMKELGIYTIQDGKIIREEFYYTM